MPLDTDSIEVMERVKRGMPARFVLLTKGIKIVSLVVYRKGSFETAKKQAKEAGFGEVSFGVVEGEGQSVSFKLARADGFQKPPTKDLTVKALLAESKLDFKPTIEIVDTLPNVVMDDDQQQTVPTGSQPPQRKPPDRPGQQPPSGTPQPRQQMPPLPMTPRGVYRTQQQWDAIVAQIEQATDENTKQQRLAQAVSDLKTEAAQAKNDTILMGDPNLQRSVEGLHVAVANELRSLRDRPLPHRKGNEPQRNRPTYRTQEEWDVILGKIDQATDEKTKQQRLEQAVSDLKAEVAQAKNDTILMGDPNLQRSVEGVHVVVANELRSLRDRPLPTQNVNQQKRPKMPPQLRPRHLQPSGQVGVPNQQQRDRQQIIDDARRRVGSFSRVTPPHTITELRKIKTETDTKDDSDFAKVLQGMAIKSGDTFEQITTRLRDGRTAALKYIKDHPDPKVGKLPGRVIERRKHSETFLPHIEALLTQLEQQEGAAQALIQTYDTLLERQQQVPFGVTDEIGRILKNSTLCEATRKELKRIAEAIQAAEQPRGYEELDRLDNPTDLEKAKVMLKHGCVKGTLGGTSDVRLLTNRDGSIEFAYKGVDGESSQALEFLGLPQGSCAMREDLSSTICEEIKNTTGLDFGFPRSTVVKIDGKSGALIEGLRGHMADPEEINSLSEIEQEHGSEKAQVVQERVRKNCIELPQQVSPESLQDVVLGSICTCQWDCKWGNMIVDGDRARPLDGGTSMPTKDVVHKFRDGIRSRKPGPPSVTALTMYPNLQGHPNWGQTMPQALQPMNQDKVKAVLNVDVDSLMAKAKARRDELVNQFPEFDVNMMNDDCFEVVTASIKGAQEILRKNPDISLVDFATEYEKWWTEWAKTV